MSSSSAAPADTTEESRTAPRTSRSRQSFVAWFLSSEFGGELWRPTRDAYLAYWTALLIALGFALHCLWQQATLYGPLLFPFDGHWLAVGSLVSLVVAAMFSPRIGVRVALILVASLLAAVPIVLLLTFPDDRLAPAALILGLSLQAVLLGLLARACLQRFARAAIELGWIPWLVHPWRLVCTTIVAGLLLVAADRAELTLFPALLALVLLLLGIVSPGLEWYLSRRVVRSARWALLLDVAGAAFIASCLSWLTDRIPLEQKQHYIHPILYAAGTRNEQEVVLTATTRNQEWFIDRALHASTLDFRRYVRSLAAPLQDSEGQGEVLVLGTGSGLLEEELERVGFRSLTVVAPGTIAHELSELFARPQRGPAAPRGRRSFHRSEALVWLTRDPRRYSAIVVDVPPPLGVRDAAFYTTHFLRQLHDHLTPRGIAVMPALSPSTTPHATQTLLASARSVGLRVETREASLVGAGPWSLMVLRRDPNAAPLNAPRSEASTLYNLNVLDLFLSELNQ